MLFAFVTLSGVNGISQNSFGYYSKIGLGEKYFIALGYGMGTAKWNSVFKSTEFYDKDGRVINTGDFSFKATSPTRHIDVNVSAPIKKVRMGLGISFEDHYLSSLEVYTGGGEKFLLFDEGLRFDKLFFQTEVPFKYETKKAFSFNLNFRGGWFGYTNVKRFNFIGDRPFPLSFLVATGITADYELYKNCYVFLFPNFEYKLYDNSRTESPVQIRHNVFTADLIAGLRINLTK